MSDKIQHYSPDGNVIGSSVEVSPTKPTRRTTGAPGSLSAGSGRVHLTVVCGGRRRLLVVSGVEPLTLTGRFVGGQSWLLRGATVVAPRPDLLAMGLDPRNRPVVADHDRPLQLWCPDHPDGHDVDTVALRRELGNYQRRPNRRCEIGRVVAGPAPS